MLTEDAEHGFADQLVGQRVVARMEAAAADISVEPFELVGPEHPGPAHHFERALSYYGTDAPQRVLRGPGTAWRRMMRSRRVLDEIVQDQLRTDLPELATGDTGKLARIWDAGSGALLHTRLDALDLFQPGDSVRVQVTRPVPAFPRARAG